MRQACKESKPNVRYSQTVLPKEYENRILLGPLFRHHCSRFYAPRSKFISETPSTAPVMVCLVLTGSPAGSPAAP
jgi:hypothetical protein